MVQIRTREKNEIAGQVHQGEGGLIGDGGRCAYKINVDLVVDVGVVLALSEAKTLRQILRACHRDILRKH